MSKYFQFDPKSYSVRYSLIGFFAVYFCLAFPVLDSKNCYGVDHSWNGESYRKNKTIQFQGALDQIKAYPFQGNEKILDVGSGDGEITSILASHTKGAVLGIDLDCSERSSFRPTSPIIDRQLFDCITRLRCQAGDFLRRLML